MIEVGGDGIKSVDLSPDGSFIAAGTLVTGYPPGGVTEVRSVEDGSLLFEMGGCYTAISPTGTLVAGGGCGVNRYIEVCEIPNGITVASFYQGAYIHDVVWSPLGSHVASSGSNNEVRLWDVELETLERTFAPHDNDVSCIDFSPDGTLLAAGEGGWDDSGASAIRIWRVSDGELVQTLEGHGVWVHDVAFSADGTTLISSGRDNAAPLRLSIRIWRLSDGALLEEYDEEVSGGVLSLDVAPSGGAFAYGRGDGTVLAAAFEGLPAAIGEPRRGGRFIALHAPIPNPTVRSSQIRFRLDREGPVLLTVHDVRGRRLTSLTDRTLEAGIHQIGWDARSDDGRSVSPGVYFIRLTALGESVIQRVVVAR
jgi:hypothetical protein